ncbi:MAG: ATP-grasp domain-containing protein [Gammaproteobacteria bacterium]|nr:ATP-grasp domain-containing protein [Gammaproteobacteria bacterium]
MAGGHPKPAATRRFFPGNLCNGDTVKCNKTLVLFSYDWDRIEFRKLSPRWAMLHAGFDLFSFPSNARLAWFDMDRFSNLAALRARLQGARAVVSNHEQFGALCAALIAEKLRWPGTAVEAVLACQHKLYAREVLERVAPEANIPSRRLEAAYDADIPEGLDYPGFVKPVKAAFSVLARTVHSHQALYDHTRFSRREQWTIRHLVEPFEKIVRQRLPDAGTAHSLMIEENLQGRQYCLDGYCFDGDVRRLGIVDAIMYPGTDAFMRWDYPSLLPEHLQRKAEEIAARFLREVGFNHGFFNMEFMLEERSGKLKVIEFNPRMAAQFSDLYARVDGKRPHEMAIALCHGTDPATLPTTEPTAACASSFVYRSFDPSACVPMPTASQRRAFRAASPDGLLLQFPKSSSQIQRDFKWLGSYRFGIVHLGGGSPADLARRCEHASAVLGWTAPYVEDATDLPEFTETGAAWPATENASP